MLITVLPVCVLTSAEVNQIDKDLMLESGCTAFFFPSANHVHVVYGPKVEFVRNAVDEAMKK
ncbi:Uncharacterised protein [Providencia stuartii]|nr:Uncharacterised protein [Providencia stuartii]